jgi:hypothetical protein
MHYPLLEHTNPPKEAELCANVYEGPSDTRDGMFRNPIHCWPRVWRLLLGRKRNGNHLRCSLKWLCQQTKYRHCVGGIFRSSRWQQDRQDICTSLNREKRKIKTGGKVRYLNNEVAWTERTGPFDIDSRTVRIPWQKTREPTGKSEFEALK